MNDLKILNERSKIQLNLSKDLKHYKRFIEKPFLKKEKETTTILLGGLTDRHNFFIRGSIEGLGYKVFNLPTPNIEAFHTGREYCNNGQCNPAYFTIGNLLIFLKNLEETGMTKEEIINNYVYFTAGACGPCRFGMYESEFRLALRNSGFDGFRVLIFQQLNGLNQADGEEGLEMNEEFFLGIIIAIILGDIINDLEFIIRPYELVEGETDRILDESTEEIYKIIKKRQATLNRSKVIKIFQLLNRNNPKTLLSLLIDQLISEDYTNVLKNIQRKISEIKIDNLRVLPRVKITGEFWAQITEGDGNFKMFKYLENEGAEIIIEPIANWLMYLLFDADQFISDRKKIRNGNIFFHYYDYIRKKALIKMSELLLQREYKRFSKSLGFLPQSLSNQFKLADLAHTYYNTRAKGGEGHLEVAKSIVYSQNNLSHMVISLKPFGCLPSTQSDGVHSVVSAHYPDLIFLPIETSGEGEINAYSRVQMALTEARLKCSNEFEKALEDTKLTVDKIRDYISNTTMLQSAGYKIPQTPGVVSRAANFVYQVSKLINGKV